MSMLKIWTMILQLNICNETKFIVQDINRFILLGSSNDNAPGEVLDKISRRLRLHTLIPELRDVSGNSRLFESLIFFDLNLK